MQIKAYQCKTAEHWGEKYSKSFNQRNQLKSGPKPKC